MTERKRIGKYEVIDEIGRGGFAVVYRARDTDLDRIVALKVLRPSWTEDPSFLARFRREACSTGRLRHANIVTVFELAEAENLFYIAMEYLAGLTLRGLLEAKGVLLLEQAVPILEQIAEALDYAHGQGMIHRDVKPSNVMVEETARGVRVTLMDFGLVKAAEESSVFTSRGTLLGSPEYMAPEQADPERVDEVGPAADRYALGIIAYHMLTGRVPFPGNTPATLYAHEHKPVPPPRSLRPDLSESTATALIKMLSKSPDERYPDAKAFVAELRRASSHRTLAGKRPRSGHEVQIDADSDQVPDINTVSNVHARLTQLEELARQGLKNDRLVDVLSCCTSMLEIKKGHVPALNTPESKSS